MLTIVLLGVPAAAADKALEEKQSNIGIERDRQEQPIVTYVDREGWQSGVGFRAMERYVERLAEVCTKRLPGMIYGIAGGKRGILLKVSVKARRRFYLAQENTEEFLKAIVGDLERMPEPVGAAVYVTCEGKEIIRAVRTAREIKVEFLL